jgi:hypothetical protein
MGSALAEVADRLLPRVGRPFKRRGVEVVPFAQPLGECGLAINLVIDFPHSMAFVNADQVEESGRPAEEWVERALDNLRAATPDDCVQVLDEDSGLCVCEAGDSYDSSRALILDTLLPPSPGGFLVAVPHRDLLFVQPVAWKAIPYLHMIKLLADKYHRNAPYSISDGVYWVHEGEWHAFGAVREGDKMVLAPPTEFVRIFESLAPEGEEEEVEEQEPEEG